MEREAAEKEAAAEQKRREIEREEQVREIYRKNRRPNIHEALEVVEGVNVL